jgi:hypothetical protein
MAKAKFHVEPTAIPGMKAITLTIKDEDEVEVKQYASATYVMEGTPVHNAVQQQPNKSPADCAEGEGTDIGHAKAGPRYSASQWRKHPYCGRNQCSIEGKDSLVHPSFATIPNANLGMTPWPQQKPSGRKWRGRSS